MCELFINWHRNRYILVMEILFKKFIAHVLCMHIMVAKARRSDQIAVSVRTQCGRSGSAKRAARAQSERSKDAHEHLVVAAGNKYCPLRLY